jgi:hypothetical protein
MKNDLKIKTQKNAMIEALEKSLGIVTTACKKVGISRQTHYNWIADDAEYKLSVESISDMALDFAESKLHEQINNNDTAATIFYLKTKGKKRGYIERVEQVLEFERPIFNGIDLNDY